MTNENLLKSIGFLPGSNHASFSPGDSAVLINMDETMTTSTDQLMQTFEMIDNPSYSAGNVPRPLSGGAAADTTAPEDDDDFVIVLPDCFNLEKPLPDFTPPVSVADSLGGSSFPGQSCDSYVSVFGAESAPSPAGGDHTAFVSCQLLPCTAEDFQMLPTSATPTPLPAEGVTTTVRSIDPPDNCDSTPHDSDSTPSSTPKVSRSRLLQTRTCKGGLYRNPLAVATGLLNAVSEFVEEKVHFTSSGTSERKPCIRFVRADNAASSESSDEEFEVCACVRVYACMCMCVCGGWEHLNCNILFLSFFHRMPMTLLLMGMPPKTTPPVARGVPHLLPLKTPLLVPRPLICRRPGRTNRVM